MHSMTAYRYGFADEWDLGICRIPHLQILDIEPLGTWQGLIALSAPQQPCLAGHGVIHLSIYVLENPCMLASLST